MCGWRVFGCCAQGEGDLSLESGGRFADRLVFDACVCGGWLSGLLADLLCIGEVIMHGWKKGYGFTSDLDRHICESRDGRWAWDS